MACKWYKINERKYTLQVLIRFTCFSISRVGSKVPKSTGFQFCHWAAWNKLLNLSGLQFICKIKLVSSRLWWFLWILALVFSLDCFSLDVVFLFQRYLSEALGYQLMEKWKLTFKKKKKKQTDESYGYFSIVSFWLHVLSLHLWCVKYCGNAKRLKVESLSKTQF